MASIAVNKNREGIKYVYLKESYREKDKVKSRILKSYGRLDELEKNEPGILERLRAEAKAGLLAEKLSSSIDISFDTETQIDCFEKNYGWLLLDELYKHLKIDKALKKIAHTRSFDLNDILRLLVFSRILNPCSKLKTVRNQANLWGNWEIAEHHAYRSLDYFYQAKNDIQLNVHKAIQKTIGRTGVLVFYDVTNYYFETDLDDEDMVDEETGEVLEEGLRRRGPSKERRPKPIVQMGLFMDTNGIPISYQLFRGNQTDPVTYIPAIEQVKKQFGLERIVVVADKAMNSAKNVTKTHQNGDGWLFSQKHRGRRGVSKTVQSFVLDPNGWEYNKDLTKAKKSMVHQRKLSDGKTIKEKIVATWNKKYAVREKIRRDGALDYIESLTNPERFRASCKKGGKKYIEMYTIDEKTGERKPLSPFLDIDYEQVDYDAQFDGINVLVTSETELPDEEVIRQYHELSRIEDCFRITKTEFEGRPVYVSLKNHIEAHFLTCFLALVLIRTLQHLTDRTLSPERIAEALNSATASMLGKGYARVQANEDMKHLNKYLGIQWDNAYVKSESVNKYAKGWFTTFLKRKKSSKSTQ